MVSRTGGQRREANLTEQLPLENRERYGGPMTELGRGGIGRVVLQHDPFAGSRSRHQRAAA